MPFITFTVALLVGLCALVAIVCWSFGRPRGAVDGAARVVIATISGALIATWLLCAVFAPSFEAVRAPGLPLAIAQFQRGGVLFAAVVEAAPAGFDLVVGAGAGVGLFFALAFFAPNNRISEPASERSSVDSLVA